jgi:hypothetical protein
VIHARLDSGVSVGMPIPKGARLLLGALDSLVEQELEEWATRETQYNRVDRATGEREHWDQLTSEPHRPK